MNSESHRERLYIVRWTERTNPSLADDSQSHLERLFVRWTEPRTNQSLDELAVTSGTFLKFIKKQKVSYFRQAKETEDGQMDIVRRM